MPVRATKDRVVRIARVERDLVVTARDAKVRGETGRGVKVPGVKVPGEKVPGEMVPGEMVPGEMVPGEMAPVVTARDVKVLVEMVRGAMDLKDVGAPVVLGQADRGGADHRRCCRRLLETA